MIIKTTISPQWVDFLNESVKPKMVGIIKFYVPLKNECSTDTIPSIYAEIEDTEETLVYALSGKNIDVEFDAGIRSFVQIYWNKVID